MGMQQQCAKQMLRVNQQAINGPHRLIATSNGNHRSDVLTHNAQQQQSNDKTKLDQQERVRNKRIER